MPFCQKKFFFRKSSFSSLSQVLLHLFDTFFSTPLFLVFQKLTCRSHQDASRHIKFVKSSVGKFFKKKIIQKFSTGGSGFLGLLHIFSTKVLRNVFLIHSQNLFFFYTSVCVQDIALKCTSPFREFYDEYNAKAESKDDFLQKIFFPTSQFEVSPACTGNPRQASDDLHAGRMQVNVEPKTRVYAAYPSPVFRL
nr:hypothetical protein Y66H1A.1 - Caenorhabditis elegans [Caenorhabditis elegans]